MAVVLAFSGCRKQQAHQVDQPQRAKLVQGAKLISVLNPQHADSLVLMAYKQGDYQRMLALTDSLSAACLRHGGQEPPGDLHRQRRADGHHLH